MKRKFSLNFYYINEKNIMSLFWYKTLNLHAEKLGMMLTQDTHWLNKKSKNKKK